MIKISQLKLYEWHQIKQSSRILHQKTRSYEVIALFLPAHLEYLKRKDILTTRKTTFICTQVKIYGLHLNETIENLHREGTKRDIHLRL